MLEVTITAQNAFGARSSIPKEAGSALASRVLDTPNGSDHAFLGSWDPLQGALLEETLQLTDRYCLSTSCDFLMQLLHEVSSHNRNDRHASRKRLWYSTSDEDRSRYWSDDGGSIACRGSDGKSCACVRRRLLLLRLDPRSTR